ncbi:MAG: hypothetical protein IT363_06180 [Methanoregulaceae archaeon]|nr:hypothetical protein [Methanoregulaceae archaeon]
MREPMRSKISTLRWTDELPANLARQYSVLRALLIAHPILLLVGIGLLLVSIPLGLSLIGCSLVFNLASIGLQSRFVRAMRYHRMPDAQRVDFLCVLAFFRDNLRHPLEAWVINEFLDLLPRLSTPVGKSELRLFRDLFEYPQSYANPHQRKLLHAMADRLRRDPVVGLPAMWRQLDREFSLTWKRELQQEVRRLVQQVPVAGTADPAEASNPR